MIEYKGKIYRKLVKSDLVEGVTILAVEGYKGGEKDHFFHKIYGVRTGREAFTYNRDNQISNYWNEQDGFDHTGTYSHRYYIEVKK